MRTLIISLLLLSFSAVSSQEENSKLHKNHIYFLPFSLDVSGMGPELGFERYIDKNNNISLNLNGRYSAVAFFQNRNNYQGGNPVDNSSGFEASIGVRFYFVEPREFNWFLGSSLIYASGKTEYEDDYLRSELSRSQLASTVDFGFKGRINRRITYQFFIQNGLSYMDKMDGSEIYKLNTPPWPTVENHSTSTVTYFSGFKLGFGYEF